MTGDICPYCGSLLTTSLKFCVSCRRSVTESKIRIQGQQDEEDEDQGTAKKFRLARKSSYDFQRQFRTVFFTVFALVAVGAAYYYGMKAINQPIPGATEIGEFWNKFREMAHF